MNPLFTLGQFTDMLKTLFMTDLGQINWTNMIGFAFVLTVISYIITIVFNMPERDDDDND